LSPLWPAADQASHRPCLLTVRDTEWDDVGLKADMSTLLWSIFWLGNEGLLWVLCKHVSWCDTMQMCVSWFDYLTHFNGLIIQRHGPTLKTKWIKTWAVSTVGFWECEIYLFMSLMECWGLECQHQKLRVIGGRYIVCAIKLGMCWVQGSDVMLQALIREESHGLVTEGGWGQVSLREK
jgi:hypothetical protein